ncbi:MAG: SagB/ThcOx family dehydrogenase [Verrucomicrobia bacterium]|nr:SagB/ThcOx family dehydrogenase [Verrucomicrobiota bacterium]
MKSHRFRLVVQIVTGALVFSSVAVAQELTTIKLNQPNKTRGRPLMETLAIRASATEWSEKELSLQDLSDLLWAANGINRPDIGKRTAASAQNAQDIDIYVFNKDGAYLYDARAHVLVPVAAGDLRAQIVPPRRPPPRPDAQTQPPSTPAAPAPPSPPSPGTGQARGPAAATQPQAPVLLLLVSDVSRFRSGTQELRREWGAIDAGIVSQNIALFCASTGLATRPRASMDREKSKAILKLTENQYPLLNHPVGYPKQSLD